MCTAALIPHAVSGTGCTCAYTSVRIFMLSCGECFPDLSPDWPQISDTFYSLMYMYMYMKIAMTLSC